MELSIILEKELLEFLGISKATLQRLRREKGLPYVRLSNTERVYPAEKFMEWINRNCVNDAVDEKESN